jgi:hypothetical protein
MKVRYILVAAEYERGDSTDDTEQHHAPDAPR